MHCFFIPFIIIGLCATTSQAGFRKQPYLIYPGDNTQMKVLYQLSASDSCRIFWGTDSGALADSMVTTEYGTDHQHAALLTDLTPGKRYYYTVAQDTIVYSGSFFTAPGTAAAQTSFFAYGDTRSYPSDHNQIAGLMVNEYNTEPELQSFVFVVGDLVTHGDYESDWRDEFFNPSYHNIMTMLANLPYQSCMGNHEQSGMLFQKYFPYPFIARRYWSFDYGPAHFVIVDQYTSYSTGSAQLNWIANDLSASAKPWKLICLHEPGWSAGGHGNNLSVQNYLQPLCEQYNVQIVFGGHNHYYARAEVNEVFHITTGGGGAPLYTPNQSYPHIITTAQVHHYCKIEIDNDWMSFAAIDQEGTVFDSFFLNQYGIELLNVEISSSYIPVGEDSLRLLLQMENPAAHELQLAALINGLESSYFDSVELFDDGEHSDGGAGDGIWGHTIAPVPFEDIYAGYIVIEDNDSGTDFVLTDQIHFTTVGPVIFDEITNASMEVIHPGDTYSFYFALSNQSDSVSARDISATLSSDYEDIAVGKVSRDFGDIGPGESAESEWFYPIEIADSCAVGIEIPIHIQIMSNGIPFWTDSLYIAIQTGIPEVRSGPQTPGLGQNYPNPFNPVTTIPFYLPDRLPVTLSIYTLQGQRIETLLDQTMPAGYHSITWDANQLNSGVYLYQIKVGDFKQKGKCVLIK